MSTATLLTDLRHHFLQPTNSTHRLYEALRAHLVEGCSVAEAARRFGYKPGSFRVLLHRFRQDPDRLFFLPPQKAPPPTTPQELTRQRIVTLRKQNLSIYDISRALAREDVVLGPVAVGQVLKQEGFARLPRRRDDERPTVVRPT